MSFLNQVCRRNFFTRFSCFRSFSSSTPSRSQTAWFVDAESEAESKPSPVFQRSHVPPIPEDAPVVLRDLHSQLVQSPHLEHSELLIARASDIRPPLGPALPFRRPQGRRRRGGTDAGDSIWEIPGSLWNWTMFAQVKEGTENKGAIESVVRAVRKSLLSVQPPLPLAANSKRRMLNGWAMIDGGDFAVHVISKTARDRYFTHQESM